MLILCDSKLFQAVAVMLSFMPMQTTEDFVRKQHHRAFPTLNLTTTEEAQFTEKTIYCQAEQWPQVVLRSDPQRSSTESTTGANVPYPSY